VTLAVASPSARAARSLRSALMSSTVHSEGRRIVVALRGEADVSTRPVISDVLSRVIAMRSGDVVIDLAQLDFIDTATVRVMAEAQRLLDVCGRTLTFRSPSRLAVQVMAVFGLTHLIEVREDARL
jgi:anti-anti-sigma factor